MLLSPRSPDKKKNRDTPVRSPTRTDSGGKRRIQISPPPPVARSNDDLLDSARDGKSIHKSISIDSLLIKPKRWASPERSSSSARQKSQMGSKTSSATDIDAMIATRRRGKLETVPERLKAHKNKQPMKNYGWNVTTNDDKQAGVEGSSHPTRKHSKVVKDPEKLGTAGKIGLT